MSFDSRPLSPDLDDSKFDKYGDLRDMSEDFTGEVRITFLLEISALVIEIVSSWCWERTRKVSHVSIVQRF